MEGMELPNDSRPFLLEFFERALEMRPELAGMATEDGTMLHTACKQGASADVIRALLNACPEAARTHNENGELPLDYACLAKYVCLENVGLLLDHYPEGLGLTSYTKRVPGEPNKRVRRERTPILNRICGCGIQFEESKTALVLFLLERFPESASVKKCNGDLPLHCACRSHAPIPVEIVQRLVEAYPQGVRKQSSGTGLLPLHWACCDSNATLEVVRLLMAQYPESIRIQDADGRLPIHTACQSRQTPLDISRLLFNSYQDGARVQDSNGQLPLHYASRCGALEIGRLLLEQNPSGARVQSSKGCLPLHFACRICSGGEAYFEAKAELARALLQYYPDGIRTADNDGRLPLHWCLVRRRTPFLRYLIELCPNAIRHADSKGQLPLHTVILGRNYHLDHIRLLIEYDLNTVLCETSDGKTPLQLLYQRGDGKQPDPKIRAFLIEKQDEALRAVRDAVEAATKEQLSRLLPNSSFDLTIAKIWELAQPTLREPPNCFWG